MNQSCPEYGVNQITQSCSLWVVFTLFFIGEGKLYPANFFF